MQAILLIYQSPAVILPSSCHVHPSIHIRNTSRDITHVYLVPNPAEKDRVNHNYCATASRVLWVIVEISSRYAEGRLHGAENSILGVELWPG